MDPIDYSKASWQHIKERLQGDREQVYKALLAKGTCTTRELATHMSWPLEDVRPRVTELCQLGLAQLNEDKDLRMIARLRGVGAREGLYTALTESAAYALYIERVKVATKETQPSFI